jgi:hypothetical protein
MKIDHRTKLSEIQEAFSKVFPHLRLAFYKTPHSAGEATSDREKLDPSNAIGDVSTNLGSQHLSFDGMQSIHAFESMLATDLGLYAQVFRRSGNLWLQTTATDGWALDEANRKGGHSEELYEGQKLTPPEIPPE